MDNVVTAYREADMYPLLRHWLEQNGYSVNAEVGGCDIAARKVRRLTEAGREQVAAFSPDGTKVGFVRGIFVREGMLIAGIGAGGGMLLGLMVCWAQQLFGIIRIPAQTFIVDTYPVVVEAGDVALIAASFIAVSYIIIKFTVARMIPRSEVRI